MKKLLAGTNAVLVTAVSLALVASLSAWFEWFVPNFAWVVGGFLALGLLAIGGVDYAPIAGPRTPRDLPRDAKVTTSAAQTGSDAAWAYRTLSA
jgi:hypothetical protein